MLVRVEGFWSTVWTTFLLVTRIFDSFQCTSKIPIFTLLIKTNAQLHLKMLSCNFYFLKNLTDFRHIIFQPAGKFNPKFLRENLIQNSFKEGVLQINHFFTSSISFLPNPIFLLLSFIFWFEYILQSGKLLQTTYHRRSTYRYAEARIEWVKNAKLIRRSTYQTSFF